MKVLFAGPSCTRMLGKWKANSQFVVAGPAAYGDVARAVLQGVNAIGIVDGRFEDTRSVWHKEILYALSQGVAVAGAASMGALRAAECAAFGMIGIGEVFCRYANGDFVDDADVAQLHAPAELGYLALSEPLANIIVTLEKMEETGIIGHEEQRDLAATARSLHYKERSYVRLFQVAGLDPERADDLTGWVRANGVDQKALDAEALANWLRAIPDRRSGAARFKFSETSQWLVLMTEIEADADGLDSAEGRHAAA